MGKKIKDYIDAHGIKQAFLVEKTNLTKSRVFAICAGSEPKAYEYYQICNALGLSYEFLFTEE